MESWPRMRPTVRGLIGLPSTAEARRARSPSDWRLRGLSVRATCSQASALTCAWSSGGTSGLAPPPGLVLKGEGPLGPAPPPEADGVGMQADLVARLDVGEVGLEVQEQGQAGPLAQVGGSRAPAGQEASPDEEFAGEAGLVARQGAGHGRCPWANGRGGSFRHARIVRANPITATLQLFVLRTTKERVPSAYSAAPGPPWPV